jgi:ubiquinone/menaquinone biosynthesis C-methylase UbiE
VLDVGCGTGRVAHGLAERGACVWGIDPSERMLAQARARALPGGGWKRASAERLPFKEGWFDAAVLRQVVHLVDRPAAFAELARVLRPGGRVVIATFDPAHFDGYWLSELFPSIDRIDRARFPSGEELAAELGRAGFAEPRLDRLTQQARLARGEALERIRGRFISTLHLVDEDEYEGGLARAERDLPPEIRYELAWLIVTAAR